MRRPGSVAYQGARIAWFEARRRVRQVASPLRATPDFLIIGAQRSGTTSLSNYLAQHPSVLEAMVKEVHFFDLNYNKGLLWYRTHFPLRPVMDARARLTREPVICGDATPYYLFHPLVARRVYETFPEIKLIVTLRNPIDRAFSHYQHERRKGREALDFEEAIDREDARLAGTEAGLSSETLTYSPAHRNQSYLARGRYAEQLERWQKFFPKPQLLILTNDELDRNPARATSLAFEFLGIPPFNVDHFPRKNKAEYEGMRAETRRHLIEYFKPHNAKLSALLGRNVDWDK